MRSSSWGAQLHLLVVQKFPQRCLKWCWEFKRSVPGNSGDPPLCTSQTRDPQKALYLQWRKIQLDRAPATLKYVNREQQTCTLRVLPRLWMHPDAEIMWPENLMGWLCIAILSPTMDGLCGLSKSFSFYSSSSCGHVVAKTLLLTILRYAQKWAPPAHRGTVSFPFPSASRR